MEIWKTFWTVALLSAGSAFAVITIVVILKGGRDVRAMLLGLKARHDDDRTH
jgi:putative exporter of polyketide antibiotics